MTAARVRLVDPLAAAVAAVAGFERLAARLAPVLPPGADIQHVGSTAVPGCLGKGDLDVCVIVDAAQFIAAADALRAVFALNPGMAPRPGFASFQAAAAGVQLVARGSRWDVFVTFRDRLRSDGEVLAAYNALKRAFDGGASSDYRAAKAVFIERLLGREVF